MRFLIPRKRQGLSLSTVCIDPAVLSTLQDTPATCSALYQKGVDPRRVQEMYETGYRRGREKRHTVSDSGFGLFIVTETGNFFFDTVNEYDNVYLSIDTIIETISAYTSEYYTPLVVIEKPMPQNYALTMVCGALAGAIYSCFGTKPVWFNPVNWRKREKEIFHRFLQRYKVFVDENAKFTPHEIDATLMYAYLFEGFRPPKQQKENKEAEDKTEEGAENI